MRVDDLSSVGVRSKDVFPVDALDCSFFFSIFNCSYIYHVPWVI